MIVHHRERMTQRSVSQPYPPLEVHLPQQVRRLLLEALEGSWRAGRCNYPAVPPQNLMNGGNRRCVRSRALKAPRNLARAPRRMGIAHGENTLFNSSVGPQRNRMGTARAVRKFPIGSKTV
jgi:hypothetical protein